MAKAPSKSATNTAVPAATTPEPGAPVAPQAPAASDWGTPPPSTTPGTNDAAPPPAPTVAAGTVENANPDEGQGRVVTPSPDLVPADTPVGATPQVNPNTPDHHDVPKPPETAGQGGEADTVEQAERTGAPLKQGGDIPGYDPNNPDASNADDADETAPTLEITSEPIPYNELLRSAMEIDAQVAEQRANGASNRPTSFGVAHNPAPNMEAQLTAPHPNEKLTDAIGSTHDASGKPVVAPGAPDGQPDGPGVPVYVGTAAPVANPDAGWRSNASS